jgi:hypothetical protein
MPDKTHPLSTVDAFHDNHRSILEELEAVLDKHGVAGVSVGQISLYLKEGSAPKCPADQTAQWRCQVLPSGEIECKWICK